VLNLFALTTATGQQTYAIIADYSGSSEKRDSSTTTPIQSTRSANTPGLRAWKEKLRLACLSIIVVNDGVAMIRTAMA
jgi:hypothetical protein